MEGFDFSSIPFNSLPDFNFLSTLSWDIGDPTFNLATILVRGETTIHVNESAPEALGGRLQAENIDVIVRVPSMEDGIKTTLKFGRGLYITPRDILQKIYDFYQLPATPEEISIYRQIYGEQVPPQTHNRTHQIILGQLRPIRRIDLMSSTHVDSLSYEGFWTRQGTYVFRCYFEEGHEDEFGLEEED